MGRGTITEWVPNERLTWDVPLIGPMAERFGAGPVTRWGFVIEAADGGVRILQVTEDMRPDGLKALGEKFLPEIRLGR